MSEPFNLQIAGRLDEVARILDEQGANQYRVGAYHRAADTLRRLDKSVKTILAESGVEGLRELPAVGETIARAIRDLILTGRLPMLDRLRGESDPVAILATVPGIGRITAHRLHDELGIDSLEELETATIDGRLADIAGIGEKRLAGIRDSLATRLGRVRDRQTTPSSDKPTINELLEVDREYRMKAQKGLLHRIAPRRFNPTHEAWLPVLHTTRGNRHYTALFSNTARAHELKRIDDWVVLYSDGPAGDQQYTVITSQRGPLKGKRIVRGREQECLNYYRN
jgi:hypothetical protein